MNAQEFEQLQNEQRRFEETFEASRKLSHAFKAECKENDEQHKLFFKRLDNRRTKWT